MSYSPVLKALLYASSIINNSSIALSINFWHPYKSRVQAESQSYLLFGHTN